MAKITEEDEKMLARVAEILGGKMSAEFTDYLTNLRAVGHLARVWLNEVLEARNQEIQPERR